MDVSVPWDNELEDDNPFGVDGYKITMWKFVLNNIELWDFNKKVEVEIKSIFLITSFFGGDGYVDLKGDLNDVANDAYEQKNWKTPLRRIPQIRLGDWHFCFSELK